MRAFTDADRAAMSNPVFAERYRRAAAHDGRFDGHFVTGWPMSENFCRPGCSTRTPRPSRVVFFRTAAAAHAAGLLPCPRCRPDMTPPAPELTSGNSVAARALRLIADGEVDRRGVSGVAKKVKVSARQILRAVETVAECGPVDVARAGRVHVARLLLTATAIPMSEVALAAGFNSVRQFNSTIMALYRTSPGTIRFGPRRMVTARRDPGPLVVRIVLPVSRPLSAAEFANLAARAVPEVEEGTDHFFARTVRLPHGAGHLHVDRDNSGRLLAKLSCADLRDFTPLLHRTQALFTRPAGPEDRRHPSGAIDHSEALIRAAVERHSTAGAARTVLGGLATNLGDMTPWGRLFPTATAIVTAGRDVMRGSPDRIDTVLRVCQALEDGDIDIDGAWTWQELLARHATELGIQSEGGRAAPKPPLVASGPVRPSAQHAALSGVAQRDRQ